MNEGWGRAGANIAFAKYWGKCDSLLNLPAVPSISMTVAELATETLRKAIQDYLYRGNEPWKKLYRNR